MTVRFRNPPLQELVAEVRWQPITGTVIDPGGSNSVQLSAEATGRVEAFYSNFSRLAVDLGYFASERLMPQGLPVPVGNVAIRHRRVDADQLLVQAGPGIVTMNALPPYKSWDELEPRLGEFLEPVLALSETVRESQSAYSVRVRYINAFGERFTRGAEPSTFIRTVLGFNVTFPTGVRSVARTDEIETFLRSEFAIDDDYRAELIVAPGEVDNVATAILDTTVVRTSPVNPAHADVMTALRGARNIAHRIFLASTEQLRDVLSPISDGENE